MNRTAQGHGNRVSGVAAIAIVALTALWPAHSRAQQAAGQTELDAALARADSENKAVIVEFQAEWCGPCVSFGREVLPHPAVVKALEQVVFVRVDAESTAGEAASDRFGVSGLPTFLVLSKAGEVLYRQDGMGGLSSAEEFVDFIARAVALSADESRVTQLATSAAGEDRLAAARWYAARGNVARALDLYQAVTSAAGASLELAAIASWEASELRQSSERRAVAVAAAADYVAKHPGSEQATEALMRAVLSGDLPEERVVTLLRARVEAVDDPDALALVVYVALEAGQIGEAQKALTKALLRKGERPEPFGMLADVALAAGDAAAGARHIARCRKYSVGDAVSQCDQLAERIEAGRPSPMRSYVRRHVRSYFLNLDRPGQAGDTERRRLRMDEIEERLAARRRPGTQSEPQLDRASPSGGRMSESILEQGEDNDGRVPIRILGLVGYQGGFADLLMAGGRGYVPLYQKRAKVSLIPSLVVNALAGSSLDGDFAYDAEMMLGFAVHNDTATVGAYSGVGGTEAGEVIPAAIHVPVELSLTIDDPGFEMDAWLRGRIQFESERDAGSEKLPYPADEISLGVAVRLPWPRQQPLFAGVSYQELLEKQLFGLWLGTRHRVFAP